MTQELQQDKSLTAVARHCITQNHRKNAKVIGQYIGYCPSSGCFWWKVSRGGRARAMSEAGRINGGGYREIMFVGRRYAASHIAWVITYGRWPDGIVDHINGDRADNRISNLREASLSGNAQNSITPTNNTSGFKGVTWKKKNQKWCAQISVGNRKMHIGVFDTPEAAHAAYVEAAKVHHGVFARAS